MESFGRRCAKRDVFRAALHLISDLQKAVSPSSPLSVARDYSESWTTDRIPPFGPPPFDAQSSLLPGSWPCADGRKKCYSTLAHPRSQLVLKLQCGLVLDLRIHFQPQETDGFGFQHHGRRIDCARWFPRPLLTLLLLTCGRIRTCIPLNILVIPMIGSRKIFRLRKCNGGR